MKKYRRILTIFLLAMWMVISGMPAAGAENVTDIVVAANDTIAVNAIPDNSDSGIFNADTYHLPPLQFDPSQPKVIISTELSPAAGDGGIPRREQNAAARNNVEIRTIPPGAIIHHSKNGVTTIFDQTGKQMFSADDSQSAMIQTPEGRLPATTVHELPSGSSVRSTENLTYAVHDNVLLFVEMGENDGLQNTDYPPTVTDKSSGQATMDRSTAMAPVTDPFGATNLEYAACSPYPPIYDGSDFSARWTVPPAPHMTDPLSQMYIATGLNTEDTYTYGRKWMTAKTVLEYDYNTSAWSYYPCYYFKYEGQNSWYYYSQRKAAHSGDAILGSIALRRIINPTPHPSFNAYHFSMRDFSTGESSDFSFSTDMGTRFFASSMSLTLKGDVQNLTEDTVIGDTKFTDVTLPYSPNVISASTLPQLPHLNIENNWPDSIIFHTLHDPVPAFPRLLVDIVDDGTGMYIPNASAGLYDYNASQWQNVTMTTGAVVFNTSGSSHQFPLVVDRTYRLAAWADGYEPLVRNVTFDGDGQGETVELARIEP